MWRATTGSKHMEESRAINFLISQKYANSEDIEFECIKNKKRGEGKKKKKKNKLIWDFSLSRYFFFFLTASSNPNSSEQGHSRPLECAPVVERYVVSLPSACRVFLRKKLSMICKCVCWLVSATSLFVVWYCRIQFDDSYSEKKDCIKVITWTFHLTFIMSCGFTFWKTKKNAVKLTMMVSIDRLAQAIDFSLIYGWISWNIF